MTDSAWLRHFIDRCQVAVMPLYGDRRPNSADQRQRLLVGVPDTRSPIEDLFYQLLVHCVEHDRAAAPAGIAAIDPRIRIAIDVIEQQLGSGRLCAADVARVVKLSPGRFSRVFKSNTGLTFPEYVRVQRNLRARDLLSDGRLSAKEVAAAVGYSPSDLSRHFSKQFGVTPTEFRLRRATTKFGKP